MSLLRVFIHTTSFILTNLHQLNFVSGYITDATTGKTWLMPIKKRLGNHTYHADIDGEPYLFVSPGPGERWRWAARRWAGGVKMMSITMYSTSSMFPESIHQITLQKILGQLGVTVLDNTLLNILTAAIQLVDVSSGKLNLLEILTKIDDRTIIQKWNNRLMYCKTQTIQDPHLTEMLIWLTSTVAAPNPAILIDAAQSARPYNPIQLKKTYCLPATPKFWYGMMAGLGMMAAGFGLIIYGFDVPGYVTRSVFGS